MKQKLLLALLALFTGVGNLFAQNWTPQVPTDGDFYLYNVGTERFLSCGESWGTQAVVGNGALKLTLANNGSGAYTLYTTSTFSYGNPNSAQLQSSGFVDQSVTATTWTFTAVEGFENTFTLLNAEGKYLCAPSDGTITIALSETLPTDAYGYWKLINYDNLFNNATVTNPVDVTCLIGDANFESSNGTMTGLWSMNASNKNLCGGASPNKCAESYRSTFSLSQVLNNVPNGEYELTAQGFYRQDGSDNEHLPVFYINEKTSTFPSRTGEEGSMNAASASFTKGNYTIDPIRVTVGDGKITLGAKLEGNTMLWCIWDNFTLKYYGIDLSAYEAQISALRSTLEGLKDSPMNATVKSSVETVLSETASVAQNQSAMEAAIAKLNTAIEAANTSINNYAAAKAYLDKASTLDEAGQASYAANETVASVRSAYDDATFEVLTDEQKNAMEEAIIFATKAQTTIGSDWTLVIVNPSFENGFASGWTNNGMDIQNNTSFPKDGNNYCEKWQPNGTVKVSQTVDAMPAGVYRLTVKAKTRGISSAKLSAGGINVPTKIADEVNTYSVEFACDANADITISFEGTGTGAGNSWIALDDFHLTLVNAGLPDVTAVTGKMNKDVAAAQTAAIDAYNAEKTVANYNAAVAAINAAQASVDAYAKMPQAITDATALKDAHNFVTAAATTTFAEAIAAAQNGYDNGTLTDAEANNYGNLGVRAVAWHNPREEANRTAAEAYMKSVDFGMNYNDWSVEGESDGSNFVVPFFEYWVSDANSLASATKTATLTDLPNGLYSVQAWVRVRAKNETSATEATGITMYVNGGTPVDVTEGTQVGETQFQLTTYEAEGLVKQGTLEVNFKIADGNNISWLSFQNVKYTKVRDLTPEEAFVAATEEDYAALNAAIEAHTLGFETGEYAPYNNIEAITALKAGQAIDQAIENSQEDVQAATAAITGASWTANTKEVNAIWDGSFEHDYSGQSGNINPIGWQRVKGAAADGYNVRLMNGSNAGLAATTSGKALFTKQSAYYGYANGYTMPLKANTMYKITFVYGGWGDCKKDGYVSMAAPDGSAVTLSATDLPVEATNADADVNAWKQYEATFTTGEAGDYVLGLRKKNYDTSGQSQYVYGDIVLVKATADDFKDQLKDELDKANAIDTEANVGEGAFQIPESAATALTSDISKAQGVYDNATATVEDVLNAIEELKAAEDAYKNAELNAPADGQLFNIILTYSGWTYDNKAITFIANGRNDQGNYSIQYKEVANQNLAQAFTFTKVDGNNYRLSQIDADGNTRYVTDGKTGYNSGDGSGIRTTTDIEKSAAFKIIATATDGVYNIWNNVKGDYIGSQDIGVFTVNSHIDFMLQETQKPSITINTTAAGWGTTILPFAVSEIPEGVKVYSCLVDNGATLELTEVNALEANKPYIIEGAWNATLTGDALGTALINEDGQLVGTYEKIAAPNACYVLQKQNDKVGFFKVDTEKAQPNVPANRAYMKASASGAKAFYLGEDTNGINTIEALMNGNAEIFNINGVKQNSLQKGINIIKTEDGKTHKIMVK